LINVAVSRAIKRFILVTNYDMLPTSRHIRDLVGYIRYHNPGEDVVDSTVVSVFDLLYCAYSQSVDFVVYNRIINQSLLAIEVDGFAFHENRPDQQARDAVKDEILDAHQMPLLRLPTTGSQEYQQIRQALDNAETHWARLSARLA
jgi:Protein of unknown function (DUF2726)